MAKRVKKRKKKKLKIGRIIIALIILAGICYGIYRVLNFTKEILIDKTYYLSSNVNEIKTYSYNEETKLLEENEDMVPYLESLITQVIEINTLDDINHAFESDKNLRFGKTIMKWEI